METSDSVPSPTVTLEEFSKVDFRIGTVFSAERVPKSKKLIRLQVSFGDAGSDDRQILAGVGVDHEPESLVGKQYAFVVNLPPREMMGYESRGMILATSGLNGLVLVAPGGPVRNGSRLG
jgi:methionine--tRNA ligase beta chain